MTYFRLVSLSNWFRAESNSRHKFSSRVPDSHYKGYFGSVWKVLTRNSESEGKCSKLRFLLMKSMNQFPSAG